MPQLSEMVKLEKEIKFFKRVSIGNIKGELKENFQEYKIKAFLEEKVVKYNATIGELTRPSNEGTEVRFFVLNYRVPTIAVSVPGGQSTKDINIAEGDLIEFEGLKFQIYNIVASDTHAIRSADLVAWHKPLSLEGVSKEISEFWFSYLDVLGLDSFREFPRWDISHLSGFLAEDFAVYSCEYGSNRDDVSILDEQKYVGGIDKIQYTFRYRKFVNVKIKIYSKKDPLRYGNFLTNQKVMYLKNTFKPTTFYSWGILEDRNALLSSRQVILNGENYICSVFNVRFGYTVDENFTGDYITGVNLKN